METRKAPSDWRIWIAYYDRQEWPCVYVHNTLPVSEEGDSIHLTDDDFPLPNTQATTIVIGKLYVHALSTAVRGGINRQRVQVPGVVQLWPLKPHFIGWPRRSLTDDEAEGIAMAYIEGAMRRGAR
jgi:hypothetical protein